MKGELAEAFGEEAEIGLKIFAEDFGVGKKGNNRAGFIGRNFSNFFYLIQWFSPLVFLHPELAIALALNLHVLGEGVHDRRTDPMQSSRNFVSALAKLPAGVELGHHDLEGRHLIFGHDIDRDSPAVVGDGGVAVLADTNVNSIADADESLVDRVVDDFQNQVV